MSGDDLSDSVFQTPDSVVIRERAEAPHPELEQGPGEPELDIGASPNLGPTTRSGKKRKHVVPVKSSGKKKTKMIRSPGPHSQDPTPPSRRRSSTSSATTPQPAAPGPSTAGPQADLAVLLAQGLSDIKSSVNGMETRLSGMESRLSEKIGMVENTVSANVGKIVELTKSVSQNTGELARLRRRVDESEENIDHKVAQAVRELAERESVGHSLLHISTDQTGHPGTSRARTPVQLSSYTKCRRSLRLWPITGPDLAGSVRTFLTDLLGFDRSFVDGDLGQFSVERIVDPRSKIKLEALIEFGSAPIRDSVKASGYKLEGKQAGIRIEVPNYLKSDFHVLQSISYRMRQANPGMKRSVKFDDEIHGLFLDVQIQGQEWRRIRPDQARAARASDPSLNTGPVELSGEMIAGAIRQPAAGTGANSVPLSSS